MGYWQDTLAKVGLAQAGPKITAQDRAILDLKLQRDKMKQYQKRLTAVLDREQEIAKQALKDGNKKRALTALRQKKYQESLLLKTDSQLQTLQELVSTIEFTQIQATVMHGLSVGNEVLKQLHQEMSLDKVEKLMDQTREGVEYQREIDETLQSRMSPEEEEAVQAELEALQSQAMPNVPVAPEEERVALPDVPVEEPTQAEAAAPERQKEGDKPRERVAMAA